MLLAGTSFRPKWPAGSVRDREIIYWGLEGAAEALPDLACSQGIGKQAIKVA
jgi:hypothetical protein